ncbi:hypothetical protein CHS0354_017708, partial [Potamilus streckersoni]
MKGPPIAGLNNEANINLVARIVFGEARGEPEEGQFAVAYTVVNRMNVPGYPIPFIKLCIKDA